MKKEIKYVIFLIGSGLTILAYLHSTFITRAEANAESTRHMVIRNEILEKLKVLDKRIYEIHRHVVK